MKGRIILNAAKCRWCKQVVVSEHRHDFKQCSCGAVAVDGGCEYLRRIGKREAFLDLSVYGSARWLP